MGSNRQNDGLFNTVLRDTLKNKLDELGIIPEPAQDYIINDEIPASEHIEILRNNTSTVSSIFEEDLNVSNEKQASSGLLGSKKSVIPLPPNISQDEAVFIGESLKKLRIMKIRKAAAEIENQIGDIGKGSADIVLRLSKEAFLSDPFYKEFILNILDKLRSNETATIIYNQALLATRPNLRKLLAEAIGNLGIIDAADILIESYLTDPEVFTEAATALFKLRYKKAIAPIAHAMSTMIQDNKEEENRGWEIAKGFRVFGEMAVEPLIKEYLECRKKNVRKLFTEAIKRIGDLAIPPLAKLLESPDTSMEAALTLGTMRHPAATDCLIEALTARRGSPIFIIDGLGRTRDQRAIEPLVKYIREGDDNPRVVGSALLSLGSLGAVEFEHLIVPYLKSENQGLSIDAAMALCQLNNEVGLKKLINAVLREHEPYCSKAAKHLNRLKEKAYKEFYPYLENETKETERILWSLLYFDKITEKILRLIREKLTNSQNIATRKNAYSVLDRFGKIDDLYEGKNDPNIEVKIHVESLLSNRFRNRKPGTLGGGNNE